MTTEGLGTQNSQNSQNSQIFHFSPMPQRLPTCVGFRKVNSQEWQPHMDTNPYTSVMELVYTASVKCEKGSKFLRVLIETGCRISLVCNHNVFDDSLLRPAKYPIHIRSADGSLMEGGSQGLFLRLRLPIALPDGTIKHNLFPPVWCFTANVDGVDLVIGYLI